MKSIKKIFSLSIIVLTGALASCGGGSTPEPTPVDPKVYTVTFDTDGGSPIESQSIQENHTAQLPNVPTKENYYFINWYQDQEKNTVYDFNTPVTQNITIYAGWGHKVTFNSDGVEEKYEPQYVLDGRYASNPGIPTSTDPGLICVGWKWNDGYFKFDENPITMNITLHPYLKGTDILTISGERQIEIPSKNTYTYTATYDGKTVEGVKWYTSKSNLIIDTNTGVATPVENPRGSWEYIIGEYEKEDIIFWGVLKVYCATYSNSEIDGATFKGAINPKTGETTFCIPGKQWDATNNIWKNITHIANNAFQKQGGTLTIKKVMIGEGIQNIGEFAFHWQNELTDVSFPTSLKVVNNEAFNMCDFVCNFDIPSNCEVEYYNRGCFNFCPNIKKFYITANVKLFHSQAFAYTRIKNTEEVTIDSQSVANDITPLDIFDFDPKITPFILIKKEVNDKMKHDSYIFKTFKKIDDIKKPGYVTWTKK